MAIRFYCLDCGQKIKAQNDMSGMKVACPTCRSRQTVPKAPAGAAPVTFERNDQANLKMADRFAPEDFASAAKGYHYDRKQFVPDDHSKPLNEVKKVRIFRGSLYFIFVLGFIPLILTVVRPDEGTVLQQLERGIQSELGGEKRKNAQKALDLAKEGRATLDDILEFFPKKKLKAAWISRDSDLHLYLAMVTSIGFLLAICMFLPKGFSRAPLMMLIGGFTGIFGIGMLLIVQWISLMGFALLAGPFAIIIFMIGIAYRTLMNPDLPFFQCLLSFTFGVGLCEEIIKALPIFVIFMGRSRLRWHECCALGMASGVGFGIAEGIHFSTTMYNGLCEPLMYYVRFISCTMLHAVWCAGSALFLHRFQKLTHGGMTAMVGFYRLVILISIPMVLHGLYDTLLTKSMDGLALAIALLSFGWLVLMIETARDREGDMLVEVSKISDALTPLHELEELEEPREDAHAASTSHL